MIEPETLPFFPQYNVGEYYYRIIQCPREVKSELFIETWLCKSFSATNECLSESKILEFIRVDSKSNEVVEDRISIDLEQHPFIKKFFSKQELYLSVFKQLTDSVSFPRNYYNFNSIGYVNWRPSFGDSPTLRNLIEPWDTLSIEGPLDAKNMSEISASSELRSITFNQCALDDWHIEYLKDLPNLEFVSINDGRRLSRVGETLSRILSLKAINIKMLCNGDRFLQDLLPIIKQLEFIWCISCKISDDSSNTMSLMENVANLALGFNLLSDCGIKNLRGLRSLRDLRLEGNRITDASASVICQLQRLELLGLEYTEITDKFIENLVGHTRIKQVGLSGTKTTPKSIFLLTSMQRDCEIW